MNQTGYYSILQHHAIQSGTLLVFQVFVLMQEKDPKHTSIFCQGYIKRKEQQYVLMFLAGAIERT